MVKLKLMVRLSTMQQVARCNPPCFFVYISFMILPFEGLKNVNIVHW